MKKCETTSKTAANATTNPAVANSAPSSISPPPGLSWNKLPGGGLGSIEREKVAIPAQEMATLATRSRCSKSKHEFGIGGWLTGLRPSLVRQSLARYSSANLISLEGSTDHLSEGRRCQAPVS
jgi:hypothetical protein